MSPGVLDLARAMYEHAGETRARPFGLEFESPLSHRCDGLLRRLLDKADMDRFHDPIERNLSVLAAFPDEILRRTAEQEERHTVRWDQDAAGRLHLISRATRDRKRGDAGERFFNLLLGDLRPVALDDEGSRGSSSQKL
jgi:hypothetical protein